MPAIPDIDARRLNLLVEEYRTIRAEIQGALAAQHQALSWGIASLAVFVVAIAAAWDKAVGLTAIALIAIVPGGIFFLSAVWGTEVGRMRRAGAYLSEYLEPEINAVSRIGSGGLAWEQWLAGVVPKNTGSLRLRRILRQNVQSRRRRSLDFGVGLISLLLVLFAVASFVVGAYRFDQRARLARHVASSRSIAPALRTKRPDTATTGTGIEASWYYKYWRYPWAAPSFVYGVECGALFMVFLILPLGAGIIMIVQNSRGFGASELPPRRA